MKTYMNTYKEGTIKFNGLTWTWKLLYTDDLVEHFKIFIENDKKQKAEVDFTNSQMEKQISDLRIGYIKDLTSVMFRWGGYADCKSLQDFKVKRMYYLVYGFINCIASDLSFSNDTFEDFCSNLGYDSDSIKVFDLYRQLQKQNKEVRALINDEQLVYMSEVVAQESEEFSDKIKELVGVKA